jgi:hypothetical protein
VWTRAAWAALVFVFVIGIVHRVEAVAPGIPFAAKSCGTGITIVIGIDDSAKDKQELTYRLQFQDPILSYRKCDGIFIVCARLKSAGFYNVLPAEVKWNWKCAGIEKLDGNSAARQFSWASPNIYNCKCHSDRLVTIGSLLKISYPQKRTMRCEELQSPDRMLLNLDVGLRRRYSDLLARQLSHLGGNSNLSLASVPQPVGCPFEGECKNRNGDSSKGRNSPSSAVKEPTDHDRDEWDNLIRGAVFILGLIGGLAYFVVSWDEGHKPDDVGGPNS